MIPTGTDPDETGPVDTLRRDWCVAHTVVHQACQIEAQVLDSQSVHLRERASVVEDEDCKSPRPNRCRTPLQYGRNLGSLSGTTCHRERWVSGMQAKQEAPRTSEESHGASCIQRTKTSEKTGTTCDQGNGRAIVNGPWGTFPADARSLPPPENGGGLRSVLQSRRECPSRP